MRDIKISRIPEKIERCDEKRFRKKDLRKSGCRNFEKEEKLGKAGENEATKTSMNKFGHGSTTYSML